MARQGVQPVSNHANHNELVTLVHLSMLVFRTIDDLVSSSRLPWYTNRATVLHTHYGRRRGTQSSWRTHRSMPNGCAV